MGFTIFEGGGLGSSWLHLENRRLNKLGGEDSILMRAAGRTSASWWRTFCWCFFSTNLHGKEKILATSLLESTTLRACRCPFLDCFSSPPNVAAWSFPVLFEGHSLNPFILFTLPNIIYCLLVVDIFSSKLHYSLFWIWFVFHFYLAYVLCFIQFEFSQDFSTFLCDRHFKYLSDVSYEWNFMGKSLRDGFKWLALYFRTS